MSIFALGDTHLSFGTDKPMDIFGGAWVGYLEKLKTGMSVIGEDDTTVLMGDLSWALGLENAGEDFAWIDQIPGRKIILKGNHDYWWNTATKMKRFFEANDIRSIDILHNNCEHFVNECAFGKSNSRFLDDVREKLRQKLKK